MNFAIPFSRNFKYLDDKVQLNINYKPKIKELDNFINTYGKNHRINLLYTDFDKDKDIPIIKTLKEKYPEYQLVMCLPKYSKNLESILIENKLPHYYDEIVTTWDKFNGFLKLNITDIIIGNDLGFEMEKISKKAKEKSISLRCYCNICQANWMDTDLIKTFFIRPEDIQLYAEYIDTFEFFAKYDDSISKVNILYKIYAKDYAWPDKLSYIIVGYEGEEDNKYLLPSFGKYRLNCRRKCLEDIASCKICDHIRDLATVLKDNKLILRIDKEKES